MDSDRIQHIFNFMEWDYLSDRQLDLIINLENQWKKHGGLSQAQFDMLEDIFARAAENVDRYFRPY